jgi:hypothetical protein
MQMKPERTSKRRIEQAVLLETTIQIKRVAGFPKHKEAINEDLKGKLLRTTAFIYREFLRTVIADIEYVYTSSLGLSPDQNGRVALSNLSRLLASGKGRFGSRQARREQLVIAAILDEFEETHVPPRRLIRFLEATAQEWVRDFFEVQFLDGTTAEIRCLLELLDWAGELDDLKKCNPFPPPPRFAECVARFLEERSDKVRLCEDAMRQPKFRRKAAPLLKVLDRMKNDEGDYDFANKLTPRTKGNWWLGDLLIALESPPICAIYTTDGLFEALCDALGKRLYVGHMS